ncbi:MAG: hypothetical protein KAG84_02110 [Bacteroidales bacterium]|nr:hypothetical protein [Bacteroidales bacterium]
MSKYPNLFKLLFILIITLIISKTSLAIESKVDSLKFYYKNAFRLYNNDSSSHALIALRRAFELSDNETNRDINGRLYGLQGYILLSQGATASALESFAKSKNIGFEIDNIEITVGGYHGLGRTYIVINDFDKAKENLSKGLAFAKKNKRIGAEAILYNAIGILEISRGNDNLALTNFREFLRISKQKKDSVSIVYSYVNIGEVYLNMNKVDSAYKYIDLANELNLKTNDAQATANIYANYGSLAFKQNNYEKSINLINQSLKISYDNNFSEFITDNYYILINDYKALHNAKKANSIYKKLDHYKDSIHKINDEKKYAAIHSHMVLREKEAQARFWEQKFKNRTIILILSIAFSIVFIVLLIILYQINKANKLKHKSEKLSLSEIIDEKNRELVTRIISGKQYSGFIEDINNSLEDINKRNSINDVKKDLQSLKKNITVKEQITNNWEGFKIQFQNVHPNFFNSLLEVEPNLTQNELRMCAYIKMNMSTKEIANLLNISDRSIQTSRYRLKKKLTLDPNNDLITYIQAI